jgi:hypothetical protein
MNSCSYKALGLIMIILAYVRSNPVPISSEMVPILVNIKDWGDLYIPNKNLLKECIMSEIKISDGVLWPTGGIDDMSFMFYKDVDFNSSLSHLNVSGVTNMSHMFYGAAKFNQPLEKWNVLSVVDMNNMFKGATSFSQSLECWETTLLSEAGLETTNYNLREDLHSWCRDPYNIINRILYIACVGMFVTLLCVCFFGMVGICIA